MKKIELWYHPRLLDDPATGRPNHDYKHLIKSNIYFDESRSVKEVFRFVQDLRNSGVIALERAYYYEDEEAPEESGRLVLTTPLST